MLNEIVHRLTNKASAFVAGFPKQSLFRPSIADEFETDIRDALRVNDDDYYLRSYIQLLHAYPDLLTALGERQRTFDPGRGASAEGSISGATLVAQGDTEPKLYRKYSEWPVVFSITYSYLSAELLQTDYYDAKVPYTIDAGGNLEVQWPTWSGVRGGVVAMTVGPGINPGASFTITQNPAEFPSEKLVSELLLKRNLVVVLRKAGLLNHFHLAETDDERIAVVVTALCIYNKLEYRSLTT